MEDTADPDFLHDLLYCMYETEVFGNRGQFSRLDKDVTQAEAALLAVPGQFTSCPFMNRFSFSFARTICIRLDSMLPA